MAEEQKYPQEAEVQEDPSAAIVTAGEGNEVVVTPQVAKEGDDEPDKDEYEEVDLYEEGTAGLNSQIDTLDKWMASAKAPETKEEREKRERKEKSRRVISAVSDGLSALSNLFFTTKYAPDMYEPKNSMTAATNAQIERARAEREKNEDAYYNFALKRGQLEHERAKTNREIEAQLEKQAIERQKALDEHDKAEAWINLYGQRKDTEEKKGEKIGAETEYINGPKTKETESRTNKNNAQTKNLKEGLPMNGVSPRRTRKKSGSGGSGGHDEVTITETYDKKGNKKSTKVVTKNNGKGTSNNKWSNTKDIKW